ncbi:hypothetical protein D9Q98_003432 [Chlorella vulgaris]|uniref:RING-type domain-containing protein n=1 Tax=Chlorella vulgaris TaxID=3077 RepID=A0A9D4YYS4_CHLVU|nr:hypothetical protein D9Q98_003432 [Chlorella vulgaris]
MLETVFAASILLLVLWAGCFVEVVRKVGKQLSPLRALYSSFRARCPYTAETLERFVEIWDMFMHCSDASLGFEDRFAIFCDQLGDFLEGLVQRAVDVLELFFQLDVADQQAALCRIPRRRLSSAEAAEGAGPLRMTACAICLCEWTKGDDVRELKVCSHVFHSRCADTWLWRHQKCPMCRTAIAT